ncbi:MAG: ATP synthase F1 subunit delta [Acidimicrobiia bacterium]
MTSEARVEAYAQALFAIAKAESFVDETADELFRFARTFEGNDELRMALANPSIPTERRASVVEELIGQKSLILTKGIASFLVTINRANDLPAVADRFVEIAAAARQHELAEVRSAVALSPEQEQRLAEALSRATGKNVEVKVVVDESVLGGVVARIGDTVIDGSVRNRLDQLKEQI